MDIALRKDASHRKLLKRQVEDPMTRRWGQPGATVTPGF